MRLRSGAVWTSLLLVLPCSTSNHIQGYKLRNTHDAAVLFFLVADACNSHIQELQDSNLMQTTQVAGRQFTAVSVQPCLRR